MLHILLTQDKLESSQVFCSTQIITWNPTPPLELRADVLAFLGIFINDCGMFNDALQDVSALRVVFHSGSVLKALMQEFLVP